MAKFLSKSYALQGKADKTQAFTTDALWLMHKNSNS